MSLNQTIRCDNIYDHPFCGVNIAISIYFWFCSAETKPVMMQDTPTSYIDCAAVYKSGNSHTGVYTLTIPNTTMEVKVKWASFIVTNFMGGALRQLLCEEQRRLQWIIKIQSACMWAHSYCKC